jgi:hypothetical protein
MRNSPDISMYLNREIGGFHNSVMEDSFYSTIGADQVLK